MFFPKQAIKRTNTLPQIRVSDQERAAAEFLATLLTVKHGTPFLLGDVLRLALGVLYEREYEGLTEAEQAQAPVKPGDED